MPRARKKILLALGAVAVAAVATFVARPYARAAVLVVRGAGVGGWPGRLVELAGRHAFTERDVAVPTRHGSVAGRIYAPDAAVGPAVLVVPGIHAAGIDEPRLVAFARTLVASGRPVVTVTPEDLVAFRIAPADTDRIEDAVAWVADQPALAAAGRPGVVGISFAGGLAIVAVGRRAVRDRVAFVLSLGGHGDLQRVLRFLCTGELPDGTREPPHEYGPAVVLLNVLDRLVPADQVEPLREAVIAFMDASIVAWADPSAAGPAYARARAVEDRLPQPAADWMRRVRAHDVEGSAPLLLPHALAIGSDPALSPERSPAPRAPAFLLHGVGDNVIPTIETDRLAASLAGRTDVRALVTPLLIHADVAPAIGFADGWRMIAFWADVLERR